MAAVVSSGFAPSFFLFVERVLHSQWFALEVGVVHRFLCFDGICLFDEDDEGEGVRLLFAPNL